MTFQRRFYVFMSWLGAAVCVLGLVTCVAISKTFCDKYIGLPLLGIASVWQTIQAIRSPRTAQKLLENDE
jgi:hypothetical protein